MLFVLVELEKVRRRYNGGLSEEVLEDEATAWAYLLTNGFPDEQEVSSIMAEFPTNEEFAERYGYAISDPEVVAAYGALESAEREWNSHQRYITRARKRKQSSGARPRTWRKAFDGGIEQSIEQGVKQGIVRGKNELVEQLRQLGVDDAALNRALANASE